MTEFKHNIGDELYERFEFDGDDRTLAYPVRKRTERFVYVNEFHWRPDSPLRRLSVSDLERQGFAFTADHRMLFARPKPDWPLMDAVVRKPEQLAIAP